MSKRAVGGIIVLASAVVALAILFSGGQQQAAIQGIPSDDTVVSISWEGGDVAQMEFVDHEPVISYTMNCELRWQPEGATDLETIAWITEGPFIPGCMDASTGDFDTFTLTWPYGDLGELQPGAYEEYCRLYWLADDGQDHFGYVPGEAQDGNNFFQVGKFSIVATPTPTPEIHRCYLPIVLRSSKLQ